MLSEKWEGRDEMTEKKRGTFMKIVIPVVFITIGGGLIGILDMMAQKKKTQNKIDKVKDKLTKKNQKIKEISLQIGHLLSKYIELENLESRRKLQPKAKTALTDNDIKRLKNRLLKKLKVLRARMLVLSKSK